MAVFEQYPITSWKVAGSNTLYFLAKLCREDGANRVVERERPYRDGAKLDDTGSRARRWTIVACFGNTYTEPGLEKNGKALYPNVLNDMIRSADEHETGDLVLPTVGRVRARLQSYSREETFETRDEAHVSFVFVEDNEDSVGARAFNPPSVSASMRTQAEATTFSAESDGVFSPSLASINELAGELEAIANFPANTLQDIDAQVGIVVAATNRVLHAFTNARENARAVLTDPDASVTQRKLETLKDTSAQARREFDPRTIVSKIIEDFRTIFDLAAELGQDANELIGLNPAIDPMRISPGQVVRVFE